MEIIKILNGYCTEDDMKSGGVFTSVTWDDLLPAIKKTIVIRDDEIIDGFIISSQGMKIRLSRKRIRKTKK